MSELTSKELRDPHEVVAEVIAAYQGSDNELARRIVDALTAEDCLSTAHEPPVDAVAGFDVFRHYVETNMPPNTVIGNPNWWAQRLWKQAVYAINEARSALTKLESPE
jgi:hypothetical protein